MTVGTGVTAGLLGGAAGLSGPPVILFWLAGQSGGAIVRANMIMFLAATGIGSLISYVVAGLFTGTVFWVALSLLPIYGAAIWLGARLFRFASERVFRSVAFALIGLTALASLAL